MAKASGYPVGTTPPSGSAASQPLPRARTRSWSRAPCPINGAVGHTVQTRRTARKPGRPAASEAARTVQTAARPQPRWRWGGAPCRPTAGLVGSAPCSWPPRGFFSLQTSCDPHKAFHRFPVGLSQPDLDVPVYSWEAPPLAPSAEFGWVPPGSHPSAHTRSAPGSEVGSLSKRVTRGGHPRWADSENHFSSVGEAGTRTMGSHGLYRDRACLSPPHTAT